MLNGCPKLSHITELIDKHLADKHPQFFGASPSRPFAHLKPAKVIHDPLWGTSRFSWRELVLIDSPFMQRLRWIHQTGLAYQVYPSARHSRFEHCLGVTTIAAKVFDAIVQRYSDKLLTIAKELDRETDANQTLARLRQELRLAALLHDSGHSLFSHASERVYGRTALLKEAAEELSDLIGKEKGSGEVLSFCIARTSGVSAILERAKAKLSDETPAEDKDWKIDLDNVALLIVGSSRHPYLQFMGDIVSSGLDADKLDYLVRDALSAGLPLRYDLERYLYTVALEEDFMVDVDGALTKLYKSVGTAIEPRKPSGNIRLPHFDTYRLRLPKRASSTMEQIVICKIMLYSYIYHHQKVRAAEGLLEKLLTRVVKCWDEEGKEDGEILLKFMEFDDTSVGGPDFLGNEHEDISETSYRLMNRILPREVYRLTSAVSHAHGELLKEYFLRLREREKRAKMVEELEDSIGQELLVLNKELGDNPRDALWTAGVWVDAPKPPQVEDVELSSGGYPTVTIENIFPVEEWTEAYQAHRYFVRVYAYSEYVDVTAKAARKALERLIGIKSDEFYRSCRRHR